MALAAPLLDREKVPSSVPLAQTVAHPLPLEEEPADGEPHAPLTVGDALEEGAGEAVEGEEGDAQAVAAVVPLPPGALGEGNRDAVRLPVGLSECGDVDDAHPVAEALNEARGEADAQPEGVPHAVGALVSLTAPLPDHAREGEGLTEAHPEAL